MAGDDQGQASGASPFRDPQQAVTEIDRLLRARAWPELAQRYDLSGSGIDAEELTSGRFFHDPEASTGHPAARAWRAPFPPGCSYLAHEIVGDRARVEVELTIDQGDGPPQQGIFTFWLTRAGTGWLLLPGPGDDHDG